MRQLILFTTVGLVLLADIAFAQPHDEAIYNMANSMALVEMIGILQKNDQEILLSYGTGIVVSKDIKYEGHDFIRWFVYTAYHVVDKVVKNEDFVEFLNKNSSYRKSAFDRLTDDQKRKYNVRSSDDVRFKGGGIRLTLRSAKGNKLNPIKLLDRDYLLLGRKQRDIAVLVIPTKLQTDYSDPVGLSKEHFLPCSVTEVEDDLFWGRKVFMMGYKIWPSLSDEPIPLMKEALIASVIGKSKYLEEIPLLLIDKKVVPGMSGGPIFYADGKVVGINQAFVHSARREFSEDITLAIPFAYVNMVVDKAIETQSLMVKELFSGYK